MINTRPLNCGLVRCNAGESTYFVHILILCSFSFDFYSSEYYKNNITGVFLLAVSVQNGECAETKDNSYYINTLPLVLRSRLSTDVAREYSMRTSEYFTFRYDNEPVS